MAELEGLIGQLDEALDDAGYFYPPERTQVTETTLRTILTKPGWSSPRSSRRCAASSALDRQGRQALMVRQTAFAHFPKRTYSWTIFVSS